MHKNRHFLLRRAFQRIWIKDNVKNTCTESVESSASNLQFTWVNYQRENGFTLNYPLPNTSQLFVEVRTIKVTSLTYYDLVGIAGQCPLLSQWINKCRSYVIQLQQLSASSSSSPLIFIHPKLIWSAIGLGQLKIGTCYKFVIFIFVIYCSIYSQNTLFDQCQIWKVICILKYERILKEK